MTKTNIAEVLVTLLILVLVSTMMVAGAQLTNIITVPPKILAYVGGTLLSFVVLGGFLIVHNCVKFMLKKGD